MRYSIVPHKFSLRDSIGFVPQYPIPLIPYEERVVLSVLKLQDSAAKEV